MKPNEINQIPKGSKFFNEGDDIEFVGMVMNGRIQAKGINFRFSLGAGSFLGINDLYTGKYICDYIAEEDSSVYFFPVVNTVSIPKIFSLNKDYRGLAVFYLDRLIYELDRISKEMHGILINLCEFVKQQQEVSIKIGNKSGYKFPQLTEISALTVLEPETSIDEKKLAYYLENIRISPSVLKEFYGTGEGITLYHIEEQAEIIEQLIAICGEYENAIEATLDLVINNHQTGLLFFQSRMAIATAKTGDNIEILEKMEEILEKVNAVEAIFEKRTGRDEFVFREAMERIYTNSQNGEVAPEDRDDKELHDSRAAEEAVLLKNSLQQIFDYADYPKGKADAFRANIEAFIKAPDKLTTDDSMRRLRREIEKGFIDLYENVFAVASQSDSVPKIIQLFFNYGFVDERLLSQEHLVELCAIRQEDSKSPCRVFTMWEWLKSIYTLKREPSRDELGQDYTESLRIKKRQGEISEEEEAKRLKNGSMRVGYEIHNAFTSTCRVTHGQFSIYVPILFDEMFMSSMSKMVLTKKMINEAVVKLLKIDFSAFHRETLYVDKEKGIEKEYIMKQVFPDIIITPVVGVNGSMWQDITGKKRDTAGRFFLPALCQGRLDNMMAKLFGNFRWELCKTIQGVNWNNIQNKSLTAEFMDYIQFYRKNRAISEERKEKIKLQIQRCRNNSREIFTSDYETWVLAESTGAIRLNKVTREILATYCPFIKEIRAGLLKQPTYEEAFARFERERNKKLKELDLKHRALERTIEIPEKMMETLSFYKDY